MAPLKTPPARNPTSLERGIVAGILIGEGHFGGDGKQPQVTLRMHVRHESLFHWIHELFPRSRLYGPYNHGGRHYYQWMARGVALAQDVLPAVESVLSEQLDAHVAGRVAEMRRNYPDFFSRHEGRAKAGGSDAAQSHTDVERRLEQAGSEFIESHRSTEAAISQAAHAGMPAEAIAHVSGLSAETVDAFLRAAGRAG